MNKPPIFIGGFLFFVYCIKLLTQKITVMAAKPLGKNDMQNFVSGSVLAPAADVIAFQKNIIPKLTTTQRDALSGVSLYEGLIIYNTTTHKINVRVAAAWEAVTSA